MLSVNQICSLRGRDPSNIKFGNTFTQDGLEGEVFDYMLSNPPFGVDWKKLKNISKMNLPTGVLLAALVQACHLSAMGLCSFYSI